MQLQHIFELDVQSGHAFGNSQCISRNTLISHIKVTPAPGRQPKMQSIRVARPARLNLIEMFKMDIGKPEQHQFSSNLPKEDPAEAACRLKWPGDHGEVKVTLPGSVFVKMSVQSERMFPLNPSKEFTAAIS